MTEGARFTLRWDDRGLVPVVVQDRHTGEVRMVAWADAEALGATLDTGLAHFFSRSRGALWRKGETSGHTLAVAEVWTDCDRDVVLYLVDPAGPTCHTGRPSCFFERLDGADPGLAPADAAAAPTLERLSRALAARAGADGRRSYTRALLDGGPPKLGAKLREEAGELAEAVAGEAAKRVVAEAADVAYHGLVALLYRELGWRDVVAELARRFGVSGHAEKASRGTTEGGGGTPGATET